MNITDASRVGQQAGQDTKTGLEKAAQSVDQLNAGLKADKFIDVRPSDKLLGVQFNGRGLYATATIEAGWFSAIKSISTPSVIAIRDDLYRSQPAVAAKIRQSAEDALPAIAVGAGARPDWKQDFDRR